MKKIFTLIIVFFAVMITQKGFSQTIYRSIASGNWGVFGTWERSTDNGATWNPAISGQLPTTNTSVIVQSPHVVTIEASGKNCVNLTINNGGQVLAGANAFSLRIGAGSSGTAGIVGTLQNDGTLGSVGDLMVLELPATASQVTLTGSGTYEIGRIRAITTNSNNPSSVTAGHTNDARLIVDKNVKLNTAANYCFSMPNSTVSATDVMIFTVNAGKTVTISDAGAKWENSLMTTGGAINGGIYTYNINGTLDLTATTTGTSAFIPYANATSSITVNVAGTVKLGTLFKADTVVGSLGGLFLNIANGGLVDATNTTSFNVGKTGTTAATTNGNIFWVVSGTGAIKRTVPASATKITFPVGTALNSYTPASITRDPSVGASATFTVGLQNTFDFPPTDATKCVNKQWNISSAAGSVSDTIRLTWTTPDQAVNFNPAGTVSIMGWNGSSWVQIAATVSGTGTDADPYIAKAYGFSSFSRFGVTSVTLVPLSLLSFNASYDGQKIKLNWATANEANLKNFGIERSADGRSFSSIGTVAANNFAGNNNYSFDDLLSLSGASFYRIKIIDNNGAAKYSNVVSLNTKATPGLSVYPNPGINSIAINHGKVDNNSVVNIFSVDGKLIMTDKIAAGALQTAIDISKLSPGFYEIIVVNGVNKNTLRFIKQ